MCVTRQERFSMEFLRRYLVRKYFQRVRITDTLKANPVHVTWHHK